MQVDDNVWHNNSRHILQRFDQQVLAAADVNRTGGKRTFSMLFRRHFNSPSDDMPEADEKLGDGDVMGAEERGLSFGFVKALCALVLPCTY